ncbi:hypothetical protein LJR098_003266 [Rhizobium sp. LjRoot98]|uniref:hypothetical protein n=1 Tax=unclassified Rhizobium TaxID=2613769 RepID=UPI0007151518|nr:MULTISPECIES: hypothetical protein [unclassified Rhizobium]KQV31341.1 hypothetical protein ASC96_09225 [Rhizobium sp. Root1204]KQY10708.1 hypothetical protein ASD36_08230 [Rhizobium sp. Root1334]KRC04696.1 hypothetical protein ASE23_05995 [Rhizobium sp. Root73]
MAEITNEMLYTEVMALDRRLQETAQSLDELVAFMRETNRELTEGRERTETLKRTLFGSRLEKLG